MAQEVMQQQMLNEVFSATSHLIQLPYKKMWIDYDKEADVVYISFNRPQKATDSKMLDNGILMRYRDEQIVGITVLDASKR